MDYQQYYSGNETYYDQTHYSTNTYKKPSKANKAKAARSVRQQTKRPCGAELKRRRKARKALENDTYNMPPSSTQGTIGMNGTVDRVAPKRKNTKQPKHQNKASFSKRRSVSSESQQPHASTSRKDHSVKKLNNPSSSFIEPTKRHLRVAVIDKNNNTGKLSQTEADIVKKTLSKQLQDFLLSAEDGTPPPRFSSFKYWGGVIKVTCDDDNSLTWLKRTITFMQPWTGATLDIVEIDLLHRLAKITIWIPGEEGEEVDRDRTIKLLTRQNPELSIPNWILFQYEDKSGEGQLFLFGVDDKTLPLLEKKNNRISYGLNSLTVNVKPADEKLEEESIETRRDISPVLQRAASSTVDTESWGTKQPASSRWDMKEVATGKKQAPYCPFEASVKQELVDLDEGDSFLDQAVDMNLFNIPNIRDV